MINIEKLFFTYKKTPLFNELSLHLSRGEICGLLGENGAGKTSLLKIMSGLIFPDQGSCEVFGKTPAHRQPTSLQEIYFLQEELYVPALTGTDYVNFYAPFYPRFNHTLLKTCLAEFEVPENKLLTELSHGQKKKFLISFGIATECRLLILDEPTNGLDIPSKSQFRKLIASALTDEKLFIISTHQVHDVENLIDSVVILDQGKIIFHQNLFDVSSQLRFSQQAIAPDLDDCFYYQKNISGYTVVTTNKNGAESHIDLEILFNALRSNPVKMQQLFNKA